MSLIPALAEAHAFQMMDGPAVRPVSSPMPKVKVDGVEIEVPQGATVLQACEIAGVEVPRFCYYERLPEAAK